MFLLFCIIAEELSSIILASLIYSFVLVKIYTIKGNAKFRVGSMCVVKLYLNKKLSI